MWEAANVFKVVAWNTDDYIRREGISDTNQQPYTEGGNLTPQRVWIATRSSLDFNLHQGFEIVLKSS